MGLIRELENIIDRAEGEYKSLLESESSGGYRRILAVGGDCDGRSDHVNRIFHCDNLRLLADGIRTGSLREKLDLIYCDPPFFTQAKQEVSTGIYRSRGDGSMTTERLRLRAYDDVWGRSMPDYLRMMAVRLFFMRDALRDSGSIFIHLDWHAVHAVRLIMDEIFGESNFVNEIIWNYKSGGATKRHFSRKHDTILFYSKTPDYRFNEQEKEKSYNRGFKPYHFKGVEEFCDDVGWYTLVQPRDVWQMDMVGRSSAERLNYASQKPEALLEKIIKAVTLPGDLCADFFCGSGTLAAAAAGLDRNFICADLGGMAIANALKRPLLRGTAFELWIGTGGEEDRPEEKGLPVRPSDMEKARQIYKEEPGAFDDLCIEGRTDSTGCLYARKAELRTAKGRVTKEFSVQDENAGNGKISRMIFDVFGGRRMTDD